MSTSRDCGVVNRCRDFLIMSWDGGSIMSAIRRIRSGSVELARHSIKLTSRLDTSSSYSLITRFGSRKLWALNTLLRSGWSVSNVFALQATERVDVEPRSILWFANIRTQAISKTERKTIGLQRRCRNDAITTTWLLQHTFNTNNSHCATLQTRAHYQIITSSGNTRGQWKFLILLPTQ